MKILISAFLCLSISAVDSTGPNSPLIESKARGGTNLDLDNFPRQYQYLASIMHRPKAHEVDLFIVKAMGIFYSKNGVLVSADRAAKIHRKEFRYKVQTSPTYDYQFYDIHKVTYTDCKEGSYGILKIEIAELPLVRHITILKSQGENWLRQRNFYSIGWSIADGNYGLQLVPLKLMIKIDCQIYLESFKVELRENEICLYPEYGKLEKIDDGTPLFADNNMDGVLAISNKIYQGRFNLVTCTLLFDKKSSINKFLEISGKGDSSQNTEMALPRRAGRSKTPDPPRMIRRGSSSTQNTDEPAESHITHSTFYTSSFRMPSVRSRQEDSPIRDPYGSSTFRGEFEGLSIHERSFTCKIPGRDAMKSLFKWMKPKP